MSRPLVSLITPVYNGAGFIQENVHTMLTTLERLDAPFELIVVSDGSLDVTPPLLEDLQDPRVVVLHYPINKGKGFALTHGIKRANGRYVGWLDSDLDIACDFVPAALAEFHVHAVDAVVGSKRHPSSEVDYPPLRRLYSWGFQMLARTLLRVKVRDTQVGAKLFRREVLDAVAPLLLVKRYAFDVEVLAVASEFGFDRVTEAPVKLEYRFSGSQINWGAIRNMLIDTLAIAYRIRVRHWYVRRFAALERARMDERAAAEGRERPPLHPAR
jgi:glycosyltransferase involved in cell wall biosynthesis